jgi:hypothetical protein
MWAALRQEPRSFRMDAQALVAGLRPPLRVMGRRHLPGSGAYVITVNHYARPGFRAWWLPLAISSVVPVDVHWIMTAAWTFRNRPALRHLLAPLSRWTFRRVARVYNFTPMPPMPPDPREVLERAHAVRQVLAYVQQTRQPVIGLAPEGGDAPGGKLACPPSGSGRFVLQLAQRGLRLVPVGAYEADGALTLSFGPAYGLTIPAGLPARARDQYASRMVMRHIAAQLPLPLRGEFR